MNKYLMRHNYRINQAFDKFVNESVLPLTKLNKDQFWADFTQLLTDLTPTNEALCQKRDNIQAQINDWHKANQGNTFDNDAYQQFLKNIGYIENEGEAFSIETDNVDDEIASLAGPQLVVPLKNARFALNAANARWGSLYDALYGTDVIPQDKHAAVGAYNPERGQLVIDYAKEFLDKAFPLQEGSHKEATGYLIYYTHLLVSFEDGRFTGLKDSTQFVASNGSKSEPTSVVLKNNGLHVELQINRNGRIGKQDPAGIDDIQMESALTTIMDCEDAIAAVDGSDKIDVYSNWLGLIQGNLTTTFSKSGKTVARHLNTDKVFTAKDDSRYRLSGRSLMMIRNVGIHMECDFIQDANHNPVPEGIVDAVITTLIASLDITAKTAFGNSRSGSIYIVKPKLHGPEEVSFTCQLSDRTEQMLGLQKNTVKLGIMDEERRTSINLKECIRRAKERVVFINTGFLDRTGDEIHTSMDAGAFLPKADIKKQSWFDAYENNNVNIGLACGFKGKAQIGKGMWAMPDAMQKMMEDKIQHPLAGANAAWVPSPTAATLHVMHYHFVNVASVQEELTQSANNNRMDMLNIPLMPEGYTLSAREIKNELENNIQSILGYVAYWIEAGIGCSKIPDINNTALMEDRATLRISSQHIANWLHHHICTADDIDRAMAKIAAVVDEQNKNNPDYVAITDDMEQSLVFKAAQLLIFKGVSTPNGYTENILHYYRKQAKNQSEQLAQQENTLYNQVAN